MNIYFYMRACRHYCRLESDLLEELKEQFVLR